MTNPTPQEMAESFAVQIRLAIINAKGQKAQVAQQIGAMLQNPEVQTALGEADFKEAQEFIS